MAHSRRRFLEASAAALALAAWPGLRRAFADSSVGGRDDHDFATLGAAMARARKSLRPLLVLVIPEDDGAKYDRGHLFGTFLNHARDGQLAPLAEVEVVCAKMASVRRMLPAAGPGEPLMVLLDELSPRARRIDRRLAPIPLSPAVDAHEREMLIDANNGALADALREALPKVAPADVPRLAALVKRTLRNRAPHGSRWADMNGCGSSIEGEKNQLTPPCGMGRVPERARRFLYFFAPAGSRAG